MVQAINHMEPIVVPLVWDDITPDIALKNAQVLEQGVMSAEVLATRQVISDDTRFVSHISSVHSWNEVCYSGSQADAKNNVVPAMPATSTSSTVTGADPGTRKPLEFRTSAKPRKIRLRKRFSESRRRRGGAQSRSSA
jgi:hypothetical protein